MKSGNVKEKWSFFKEIVYGVSKGYLGIVKQAHENYKNYHSEKQHAAQVHSIDEAKIHGSK